MKSIKNKAVKNMLAEQISLMLNAGTREELQERYDTVLKALKTYYDICLSIAEYNEVLKAFEDTSTDIPNIETVYPQ